MYRQIKRIRILWRSKKCKEFFSWWLYCFNRFCCGKYKNNWCWGYWIKKYY